MKGEQRGKATIKKERHILFFRFGRVELRGSKKILKK